MDFRHDLHVHTELSPCGRPEATLENYLQLCKEFGIDTLGISNHLWDEGIDMVGEAKGWRGWYKPLTVHHVQKIRKQIPEDTGGVKVLIGCEAEFTGRKHLALTESNALQFDYVLIAASHFHMKDLVIPQNVTDTTLIRELLFERFKEAVSIELDVPVGIAHPFHPQGFDANEQEILSGISDEEYGECLELAALNHVSIEIHKIVLASHLKLDSYGFSIEFGRMIRIAKEVGCTFHLGTDSHSPDGLKIHRRLVEFARLCGISAADLTSF